MTPKAIIRALCEHTSPFSLFQYAVFFEFFVIFPHLARAHQIPSRFPSRLSPTVPLDPIAILFLFCCVVFFEIFFLIFSSNGFLGQPTLLTRPIRFFRVRVFIPQILSLPLSKLQNYGRFFF